MQKYNMTIFEYFQYNLIRVFSCSEKIKNQKQQQSNCLKIRPRHAGLRAKNQCVCASGFGHNCLDVNLYEGCLEHIYQNICNHIIILLYLVCFSTCLDTRTFLF